MTTMRVITIVCWSVAALVLIGLATWFVFGAPFGISGSSGIFSLSFGGWDSLTGPYELVGTYTAETRDVDSLYIDWVSSDVTVEPYDGADIKISEYAQRELRDGEHLSLNTAGGTVTIKFREDGKSSWNMPQKKLEVLVPRQLCERFNRVTVGTTSGRVYVSDVKAETFKADTVSGGVQLTNIYAKTFEANSTSGSLDITGAEADEITLGSVSGSIRLSETIAQSLDTDSTSGSHDISGSFEEVSMNSISGRLVLENTASRSALRTDSTSGSQDMSGSFDRADLQSVSGTIKLRSGIVPSSLTTDTTSGSVSVTIPKTDSLTVRHSSVSGSFSSDFPVIMQSSGASFRLSTVSGSVKIYALDQ